jgi:hypothetical protein
VIHYQSEQLYFELEQREREREREDGRAKGRKVTGSQIMPWKGLARWLALTLREMGSLWRALSTDIMGVHF